jgi:hypothetical protein
MNKRKAMIGYATFWVGRRLAQRMVRRQVKRRLAGLLGTGERSAARRRLPIVGALVAAAAAVAIFVTRNGRGIRSDA